MRIFLVSFIVFLAFFSVSPLRSEEIGDTTQKSFTSIRPKDMERINNLHDMATHLMEQKDFRGAIEIYQEILLSEPDDDRAYTYMGQAYMVLGDFKRAADTFKNALHIDPDNEIAIQGLRKIADPDS